MPRKPARKRAYVKSPSPTSLPSDPDSGHDDAPNAYNDAVFSNWTLDECTRLIDYIKANGYNGDVTKLTVRFPGHTPTNVRHFMNGLNERVAPEDRETEKLVENFDKLHKEAQRNTLSQSEGSVLATFVEWKAKFEMHPLPESCGGVDYAAIYRCISSLMLGQVPRALDGPSAAKLLEILDRFLEKVHRPRQDLPDPPMYKLPVSSKVKNKTQCNDTLAKRRSPKWTVGEILRGENLIHADLSRVRELYLSSAWANPFRYPDEPSRFRQAKVEMRKVHKAAIPDDGDETASVKTPAPKKRRYKRQL